MDIEFRFFREKPSPLMIYPESDYLVNHLGVPMGIIRHPDKIEVNMIIVKPLLYTGLKDINGNKIYDGDICVAEYYNYDMKNTKLTQQVTFENGAFWMKSKNHNDESDLGVIRTLSLLTEFFNPTPNKIEVIGNIYENPELLD